MTKLNAVPLGLACLLASAATARADVGTPLLWAGFLHLCFGNALIGVGEGLAISRFFQVRKRRAIPAMIIANYFSAWIGAFFISGVGASVPMDLYTAWRWFWIIVVVTFLLTLIVEWPFVAWCFRGANGWFRRSIRASLTVQTASYMVLFGWYWLASDARVYTSMQVVPPEQIILPKELSIYFISADDGNVYRRSSAVGRDRKVRDLHSRNSRDRLSLRLSSTNTNSWELVAGLWESDARTQAVAFVQSIPAQTVPITPPNRDEWPMVAADEQAPRLGSATNSDWIVWAAHWNDFITCYNQRDRKTEYVRFETPFAVWRARHPFLLPADVVLFQFGENQICALSLRERKLALLCRGRGVVPILEQSGAPAESSPPP